MPPAEPTAVVRLETAAAQDLAHLAMLFDDLQYVLLCCEQLVTAICGPATVPIRIETHSALVEALWTGALVGYARCFSGLPGSLGDDDVATLDLEGEVMSFHASLRQERDDYVSAQTNPRELTSVGVALDGEMAPSGIAVMSAPRGTVDDATVRMLGSITYGLRGLVDERMAKAQQRVLDTALAMPREELHRLPQVQLVD